MDTPVPITELAAIPLEPLHRALRPHVYQSQMGRLLQHPLIVQMYWQRFNAIYNRQYTDKLKSVRQARTTQNWQKYVWLHERPFRVAALAKIARRMPDDQFWRLLAEIWADAENIFERREVWRTLWTTTRPKRDQVMSKAEHDALANLRERRAKGLGFAVVPIYRGCRDPEAVQGLSWTVSRKQAISYANRGAGPDHLPLLASAVVRKGDIQAYFAENQEVVVLPEHCQNIKIKPLPLPAWIKMAS